MYLYVIINVETRNAFAPLASECTDDKHTYTKAKRREKCSQKGETLMQKKAPKRGCNVKIIGASMVRGQGERLTDRKRGIAACCFPCPGAKAEGIQRRLKGIVSKRDDVIVLLGGTNNIPTDDVATCITKIGGLVKEVERRNKSAQIILSEIPIRFDDVSLNEKIEKVNIFIKHLCTKSKRLHPMNLSYLFRSHFGRDGLHFSDSGKLAVAKAAKEIIGQSRPCER